MSSEITHEGEVVKALDGVVYVRITQEAACAGCHARSACHAAGSKEKVIEVASRGKTYRPGDKVVLSGSSSQGLKAVWLAFVVPLLLIFASLFSLLNLTDNEAVAIVVALLVAAIYYYVLHLFRDRLKGKFVFEIKAKE